MTDRGLYIDIVNTIVNLVSLLGIYHGSDKSSNRKFFIPTAIAH